MSAWSHIPKCLFNLMPSSLEGDERCICNQDGSEAALRSHLCRTSAQSLAQRKCPSMRALCYYYGHHQQKDHNHNRGDPSPAQHRLVSRCMTAVAKAGKDVEEGWVLRARNRSKGWSYEEPDLGQVQNCPELVQANARGYFPAQQGLKDCLVRRFQREFQDWVTLTGPLLNDLIG